MGCPYPACENRLPMPQFTPEQMRRYERHFALSGVGFQGQLKLKNARVLVAGAGGLGSPALLYLAAAGIGRVGVADGDAVDLSNLQRQIVHFTPDVGKAKTLSAREKIRAVNPDVEVIEHPVFLSAENALGILADYDFIVEGSDNFATKFLVNDACVLLKKPFSHAGMLRFEGQAFTHVPGSRCYRCLFRAPPPPGSVPNCADAGILGMLPGILGSIQAAEAVKYLLGLGELLTDRLLIFDALAMRFREIRGGRDPGCPVCGDHPSITELRDVPLERCES
jgi:molybdopterin/thiamine biosynthesis adenylyltransferase